MQTKLYYRSYICNRDLLFPQHLDKDIPQNSPVRLINSVIDRRDLSGFRRLYKERGRSPYDPQMMLKVIVYAYMNNNYSYRRIEELLKRDIQYIWLTGYEQPDFITINRFRNRVKSEINNILTQIVLLRADKGFVNLDVEYIAGTKIESKPTNTLSYGARQLSATGRIMKKISVLLEQIDEKDNVEKAGPILYYFAQFNKF